MNLHAIAGPLVAVVNPPVVGSILTSTGYADAGDASFTGSITGDTLTVSAVASGALAAGSDLTGLPGTIVSQLTGSPGGLGTYQVSKAQTVASQAMACTGSGTRVPSYATTAGVSMQFQALTGKEVEHLDSLNIQGVVRAVYLYGNTQGLIRADGKGEDILQAPTGITQAEYDTWKVEAVLETWSAEGNGWCKVACVLQNPPADQ